MAGKLPVSPLAPKRFPRLTPIAGVKLASVAAGERYKGRHDLMLATMPAGTTVAGTLTRNRMPGQPVVWCRKQLPGGAARALLVNAGNANVFTGKAGQQVIENAVASVAKLTKCKPNEVFVASTGVIGQQIKLEKVLAGIPKAHKALSEKNWTAAAKAICTTDTYPKGATRTAEIGGKAVHISGFCKGSGMIMPDMATMLCFIFTDARLPAPVLRGLLRRGVDRSFNCITVDGDTSTSDTVLLFATGAARNRAPAKATDPALAGFRAALDDLLLDLAQQVVKDGEGASKFVEINVTGAASADAARRIGLSIGNSPLVKTALAAGDANWGRIVMAVGKSGEMADRDRLSIAIGGIPIAIDGYLNPDYREETVVPHMKGDHIVIDVALGIGRGKATVWTCDLTHQYVSINADYRS